MKTRNQIPSVLITATLLAQLALPAADAPMPRPDGKPADMTKKVKVFILLGQSNMVGAGKVKGGDGSLEFAVKEKKKYPYLMQDDGKWTERQDVRFVRYMSGKGPLNNEWMTVKGNTLGPEFGIGHVLGNAIDAPVMTLKCCIGNRALGWDLLPPGSERSEFVTKDKAGVEKKLVYAGYKDKPEFWEMDPAKGLKTEPAPWLDKAGKPINWYAGKQWDDDTGDAKKALADLEKHYPGAKCYEVAGFFFWQGERDAGNAGHAAHYEKNLVAFIKALRKEFNAPDAKFVCGTLGEAVKGSSGPGGQVLEAHLAVDGSTGKYPEFKGNVATIYTHPMAQGGSGNGHYGGKAEVYMDVGEAMGKAMVELLKNTVKTPGETQKLIPDYQAMKTRPFLTLAALLLPPLAALHATDAPPASLARDSGPAANLLQNPSFEEKAGDGVEGWMSRAWAGNEATRWSVETPGRTGERCVSIASDRGGDAAWTAMVSVQPRAWYRLSGWIKTREVRGAVGALLNIQNMQAVRTRAVSGTRDWTCVATVFQAEVARLEINCLFGGWGSSTGQAWYDDVALEPVAEPPDETRAVVTIDTGAPAVPYSPMIFGGFLEHFERQIYGGVFQPGSPLSDEKGFRRDVLAALKELKVPIVRWPGGCFVSGYHWEAGVGKERKPTDDMAWGVVEPNTFGTDEYVELCRTLGWTPYICNNEGNGTVEEMRNWVEYCNGNMGRFAQMRKDNGYSEPRNVPLWSIGNENWGQHEIGYKPIAQWAPLVLEAAKAMKQVDSRIQLTAAALPTREWTLPLLKAAGDYLDYISIHSYWLPLWGRNDIPDYLTCIMHSESPEKMVGEYIGVLDEAGYRGRIKIAFDEWNLRGWHHPGFPRKTVQDYNDPEVKRLVAARENNALASQYTMADALFSASFFNACLRHAEDVGMANIAPLVNTRGPLFVHPKGIVKRTHFHAMAMYANELEPRVGKLELEAGDLRHGNRSIPVLDGVATVDESENKWAIALVNRHPAKPVACTVRMRNRLLDGEHAALVLAGDSPEAFNDIENPNRVTPQRKTLTFVKGAVNLPPHSLTIVKVPLR